MRNGDLIIINPRILNDMIIAQEGCQPDREYLGEIRIQVIVGKQRSIRTTLPCQVAKQLLMHPEDFQRPGCRPYRTGFSSMSKYSPK